MVRSPISVLWRLSNAVSNLVLVFCIACVWLMRSWGRYGKGCQHLCQPNTTPVLLTRRRSRAGSRGWALRSRRRTFPPTTTRSDYGPSATDVWAVR